MMSKTYGGQNMVDPLRRVLVKRPDAAFGDADPVEWHYVSPINLDIAQQEHDALVDALRTAGAEVISHDIPQPTRADSIFAFDPAIITDAGAVILSLGKELRRGEEAAMAQCFEQNGIPIHYTLHGKARAEGGDLLWVDDHTLAIGLGFRTNPEGLRQLKEALEPLGVTVMPVELPYFQGPEACLHLLSMISMIDHDLAIVYPSLMAVSFWQFLQEHNIQIVEVPEEEFPTMGPNVLALAPRQCLMLQGNPITKKRLEDAGCTVQTYKGDELSLKAEGGPTCLTRPILRA